MSGTLSGTKPGRGSRFVASFHPRRRGARDEAGVWRAGRAFEGASSRPTSGSRSSSRAGGPSRVAAERMTGMRAQAVAGFASAEVSTPRIYLLADASPLGTAIPSSTDLRKGERRWTTGKGEHGARTGRIAGHPQQGDDPGLPAHRAPAVRPQYGTSTADMKHVR